MPEDTEQANRGILDRLDRLEKWQSEREEQQIKFPLDANSLSVLNKYYLHIIDIYPTFGGAAGKSFVNFVGQQDNIPTKLLNDSNGVASGFALNKFNIQQLNLLPYSVDATTDKLTLADDLAIDSDGMYATFYTNDAAPGGITAGLGTPAYKLNNVLDLTFQIQDTNGGTVNITSAGTGRQFLTLTDSNGVGLF